VMTAELIERCRHNFIIITKSSYRGVPYKICSKCGDTRAFTPQEPK
jgi:hypothetical protein